MPHNPPVPIGATLAVATATLIVTFDRPLTPGATAAANWSGHVETVGFKVFDGSVAGVIAGNQITITVFIGLPGAAPNRVSYLGIPPDVVSTFGIPAAPFVDFPLTVLP